MGAPCTKTGGGGAKTVHTAVGGAVAAVAGSSAEPLVLLDEFALSEIDPAPRGTAELLVRFELTRAAGASTPLLRVTCANQLQQRPGTANPCVTVPVVEYL